MKLLLRKFCDDKGNELLNLADLITYLRPVNLENSKLSNSKIVELIEEFNNDPILLSDFSSTLASFIGVLNIRSILTESGILPATAFSKELKNRIGRRILPPLLETKSLEFVFDKIFTEKSDGDWLKSIDPEKFHKLVEMLWSNSDEETKSALSIQLIANAVGYDFKRSN